MDIIRLLVADDQEIARAGLRALLQDTEIEIVAEVANSDSAVRYVFDHPVDVVLLDIRMNGKRGNDGNDGLAALGRIRIERPDLPVLIVSNYDNPVFISRAHTIGASGYLLKDCTRATLLKAIRQAASGKTCWAVKELRRVSGAMATPRSTVQIEVPLTQRESEVLRLICLGQSNQKIGANLHISYETVKEHVQNIFRKTGVSDRTQVVIWAIGNGLA